MVLFPIVCHCVYFRLPTCELVSVCTCVFICVCVSSTKGVGGQQESAEALRGGMWLWCTPAKLEATSEL